MPLSPFEALPWDSAFFGFPVVRIHPDVRSPEALRSALDASRERGTRLAYWLPPLGDGAEELARALGGTVVGTHVRYERAFGEEGASANASLTVEACGAVSPEIEALAVQAGLFSRFGLDPAMPAGTVERLYRLWIRRSLAGPMGDEILVEAGAGGVRGLVTLKYRGTEGEIGLVAVAEHARGSGAGRALMQAAHQRYGSRGIRRGIVVTQGENRAACGLYEASGYVRSRVSLVAHFWLRPG